MADPISSTIIGAIAGPIFDQMWQAGSGVFGWIQKYRTKKDLEKKLISAIRRYEDRYRDRHGQIKVMPGLMKEPVPLDSIYTAVKLLNDRDLRYFRPEQDLEEAYRQSPRRSFQLGSDKRVDGMAIANQKQFLMVLGGPGIGKSTFLRKLGSEALKKDGQFKQARIPVFVELKGLRKQDVDLFKVIAEEFETCGFPAAKDFTAKALEQGSLLVLLDGLDEVPKQNLNAVTECIEDFVDRHDRNCFVASCRIAAYDSSFRRFTDVTIAEFDDEQIEQFIKRWFNSKQDRQEQTAERYWEMLSQPENKGAKELAQTPLLLTFLCLVYDREQTLPKVRSSLYGDALNILLKEWAAQKRLERDPIYEGFYPDLEKELLAQIAYDSFVQDQLFFSKTDITKKITDFLSDTLDVPKRLDGEAVLKAIEVQQGLLVERATETYSFSHLTIQEYLTAQYIVSNSLVEEVVEAYALRDKWREVLLLIAGLSGKRLQILLLALEREALKHLDASQKLRDLVEWAETVTNTAPISYENRATALAIAIDSAIARAIAIDSAIDSASAIVSASASARAIVRASAIDRAIDRARAIVSARTRARARASAIDRASAGIAQIVELQIFNVGRLAALPQKLTRMRDGIPATDEAPQAWRQWADELEAIWLNAFDLTKGMVTLSQKDAEALANYLYLTELIIRCKESAVRVSKKEWEALESRLLTLKGLEA